MGHSEEDYEYLSWFYSNCDFGPADGDVRAILNEQFEKETNRKVPYTFRLDIDEEE